MREANDLNVKIGQKIIQIRQDKGIRQVDLAINTNIDDGSLRRIESGKTNPTLKTLEKIASGLGVPLKELLDFED